jgi:hypothetical protein
MIIQLGNLKSLFCKNANKSWMVEAKYLKSKMPCKKSLKTFLLQRFSLKMPFSACF